MKKIITKLKPLLTRENMFGDPFLYPHPTKQNSKLLVPRKINILFRLADGILGLHVG